MLLTTFLFALFSLSLSSLFLFFFYLIPFYFSLSLSSTLFLSFSSFCFFLCYDLISQFHSCLNHFFPPPHLSFSYSFSSYVHLIALLLFIYISLPNYLPLLTSTFCLSFFPLPKCNNFIFHFFVFLVSFSL